MTFVPQPATASLQLLGQGKDHAKLLSLCGLGASKFSPLYLGRMAQSVLIMAQCHPARPGGAEALAYRRGELQLVGAVVQLLVEYLCGGFQGRELGQRSCQLCFQHLLVLNQLGALGCYGIVAAELLLLILPHQHVPEPARGDNQPEV